MTETSHVATGGHYRVYYRRTLQGVLQADTSGGHNRLWPMLLNKPRVQMSKTTEFVIKYSQYWETDTQRKAIPASRAGRKSMIM